MRRSAAPSAATPLSVVARLFGAVVAVLGSAATPLSVAASNITHNRPILACAVCFGDPESPLTKGALMGVYVLVGVVGFVLAGIAGTGAFWIQRSRRLARFGTRDTADER